MTTSDWRLGIAGEPVVMMISGKRRKPDPDELCPCCPRCGCGVEVTLMAGWPDPNRARCRFCGPVGLAREMPQRTRRQIHEAEKRRIDLIVNPPCIGPIGPMPRKAYRRPGDLCYLPTFGFRKWSQAADRAKAGQP